MPRLSKKDFKVVAEYIVDEFEQRKGARKDLDKDIVEIDRQLLMKPDISHKLDASGKPIPERAWLPEVELPLQSQCLEVLCADARRMEFPDSGTFFESHALVDDKYFKNVELESFVAGDENDVPSIITQDNANQLVTGVLDHWHRQYDFFHNMDLINAEAFKYGVGIGIPRLVTKNVIMHSAKGVVKQKQTFPALIPGSIKNTYLDTKNNSLQTEGLYLGGSDISFKRMRVEDLKIAARRGTDPLNQDGGWMPAVISSLTPDKDNCVELIEMEGDFVVPRKTTDNIVIESAIITVAKGKSTDVVRVRYKKHPFPSKIHFPYHTEHVDNPYATSPLRKGKSLQKAAVHALSKYMEVAALNAAPPVQYDSDDQFFAANGGAHIYPHAQWPSVGDMKVHNNIGDPNGLFQTYVGLLNQYADVTGINAPRLGAQTVSHTTAFAKEAELNRGTVRTVDYVRNSLKGGLSQWLHIAYTLGREAMKKDVIFIPAYNGFVELDKNKLPEEAVFDVFGSGAPAEEMQKEQKRMNALQTALSMDQMNIQLGGQPSIDLNKAIEQTLRKGEWTDVESILRTEEVSQGTPVPAGMGGDTGIPPEAIANSLQTQ